MQVMSFDVTPRVLTTVGDEVLFLGGTTGMARLQADRIPDATGGAVFMHLQDMLVESRTQLITAYERGNHYPRYFASAGLAIKRCADEYRYVDLAARERIDSLMTDAESLPDNQSLGGDPDDHGATRSSIYEAMDSDAMPGDWSDWTTVRGFLDYGASLTAWLSLANLYSSPIDGLLDSLAGEWEVLDEAWNSLHRLELYWEAIREEMAESIAYLDTGWSGNAASRVFDWFDQFDGLLRDHAIGISERKDRVIFLHDGLQITIEGLRPYLDMIAAILEEYAASTITWVDAAGRLVNVYSWALMIVDGLFVSAGLVNLGFSLLPVRDLRYPDDSLSALTAPDVAGP